MLLRFGKFYSVCSSKTFSHVFWQPWFWETLVYEAKHTSILYPTADCHKDGGKCAAKSACRGKKFEINQGASVVCPDKEICCKRLRKYIDCNSSCSCMVAVLAVQTRTPIFCSTSGTRTTKIST
jgi:hypothetical protein